MKKSIVIGAGIAGIATSIRLAKKGYTVEVYESNRYPGGKLSAFSSEGYRFDAGPSLFTMPQYVDATRKKPPRLRIVPEKEEVFSTNEIIHNSSIGHSITKSSFDEIISSYGKA